MRLKSLEIKGFKSFGNPTTLYFDENVTGVVGPNGSGKSNVVDAFRWVLGEQKSKELRLEQMGDVLFNGADKKQQANHAEVSITFDNTKNILPTEYNTVKITRALYRSGDSEYRINDVACRLKDIHVLLMDTGIGSNSYSIIELGMVDDILQDKENARRRMFEQAAGISKFKKRKKETLQKLKLTNADLERIEDLLFEIKKNLKDLEKQAKRTKKYFEIKEKYKESSILLYKLRWDHLEEGVHTLTSQIEEHKIAYNDSTALLSKKEAVLEEEKRKNLEGEKNLSTFQKTLNELLDRIRRSENEKNLLAQKIKFSENNIDKANKEIATASPQLAETQKRILDLEALTKTSEEKYKSDQKELLGLQSELDKINEKFQSNKQYQQSKVQHLQELQNTIFTIDKKIAVLQNQLQNIDRERKQSKEQIEKIQNGLEDRKAEYARLTEKLALIDQELAALNEKETNRLRIIEETEASISTKKDQLAKHNRALDALQNERNLLQSMVENLEGFSESVKFLHKKWDGEKVLLSDVINTSEKFRAGVEQVLHPYLNYFIVEDISAAKSAINLLQNSQKGKAQFFILSEISNVVSEKGSDALSSKIETDNKYKGLIDLLCGDVYISEEDEIFKEGKTRTSLITSNGGILRSGNQMIGGSVGLFEGKKIGRKKRIEQLDKQIVKLRQDKDKDQVSLEALVKSVQDLKVTEFKNQIKIKETLRSQTDRGLIQLKTQLDSASSSVETIEQRILDLDLEQESRKESLLDAQKAKGEQEAQISTLQKELSSQDSTLESLTAELSQARSQFNEQNIKLIQVENHLSGIRKDIGYQQKREEEIKKGLFEAQKLLARQLSELEESNTRLAILIEQLQKQYESKTTEQEQLSNAEQEYFKARALSNEVEDEIRKISKTINDQQFLINQLKDKLNDFKFKKNSIKERLNIEFSYNLSDLLNIEVAEEHVEAELDLLVEKYKRRLDNYGEINPMALEAYDEMEKRYEHITEQRDDIVQAKASLMNTISEIEETATQLFLDSFNEVRKHFVTVFRSLFTQDDDCDLILVDEEDPLNSKIEIIAKPKGKRPKSLSQLSGGEKTLTATALLFSLYLLKPAPFCIFDEVDAPLDDTNIQKFANIIRAFSDKSQFIIVTHNKATMSEVDVLYGVFMQKKGISSVSAVDFRSYEDKGTVSTVELNTY